MREYAEAGNQLIVGEVFGVEQAARTVAADYPETAFLMGSSLPPDAAYPNFAVFDNYIQDASYLTGIIAGAMTKSGKIGVVGGFPIPEVNRLVHAFMAGVRETRPDATFQVAFIGSWFDPPKAKETAFAQIEAGADVMYAERFGVSDAAKERGVLAIGNVIDTQADYPDTVVASALWHFEPTLDAAIAAVKAGVFKAADYGVYSFMKQRRLLARPARHLRGQGARSRDEARRRARGGDQGRQLRGRRSTTASRSRRADAAWPRRSSSASTASPSASAPQLANDDIGFALHQGEVIALLGENGAGKTTLMNILFGHYVADAGSVEVMGRRRCRPASPRAALEAGSAWCTSTSPWPTTSPSLENIVLGTRPLWSLGARRRRRARIARPRRGASASRSTPTPASPTSPSASASGSRSSRPSTATPAS